jgi:hypothetical protein
MEIYAIDGGFSVGMMHHGWDSKWNKDNTLSVWATGERTSVMITTNRGTFIEAVNEAGEVVGQGGDGEWCHFGVSKKPIRLRYKALPVVKMTKAQIDKQRKVVTRYLLSDRPYSLDLPGDLPGMIEWMKGKLAEIPKACRGNTSFKFDTTMEYGETYPNVELTYQEPETDEEVTLRLKIEAERERVATAKKKAQLAALKEELEPSPAHS